MHGNDTAASESSAPRYNRRSAVLVLSVVAVLLGVVLAIGFAPKGRPVNGVLPNDPTGYAAPEVSLRTLAGKQLTLSSLRGKPVVVNFWASWCVTCIDEAAMLGKAERAWRGKGVVFIGIDSSDRDAPALAFMRKYGIEYDSFVDERAVQTPIWGVTGYPETFFIGRDGRITSKYVSVLDRQTLDARVRQLLAG